MYSQKQINSVMQVLKSNKTNYWTGNECKKFEKEYSQYLGVPYCIAVSNGSVALEIALKSLNLKKNDEVIVSPRSFVISASCVSNLGLKTVFADVNENGNLEIDSIKKNFTKKIKAIILVHLNGLSCDLEPIVKFAKEKKIYLIEDCSQAHGAIYKRKPVGTFGDIATWSFCQDKIISTGGEGGMISTRSKKLWMKCWSLKEHGKNYKKLFLKQHKTGYRWIHDQLGSNHRLTEMQATIGRLQLKDLNKQIRQRNKIAFFILNNLKDFYTKYQLLNKPNFKCKTCPKKNKECNDCKHAFYRLNLFVNPKKINQIKFIEEINKNNIPCNVGPCSELYKEKVFKKLNISLKKPLMNAKKLGMTSISFPITPFLKLNKAKKLIFIIKKTLIKFGKINSVS